MPVWAQDDALRTTAPIQFEKATVVEPHLPQSSVYAIVEDQQGFLWFATREGIGRWDGYAMRTWKHDPFEEASLPGNVVREMVQDRYGHIWLTAQDYLQSYVGVARMLAPAFETVQRYGFAGAYPFLDETGHPLLATSDSLYRYDPERDRFLAVAARAQPGAPVVSGLADHNGTIWLGMRNGRIEACDAAAPSCRAVPWSGTGTTSPKDGSSGKIFEDDRGTVWVGTARGFGQVKRRPLRIERSVAMPPHLADHYVTDFKQDAEGYLWMLTSDGVYRFDPDVRHYERFPLATLGDDTQNLAPITLHIDRAGSIWVGTVWGVYRYSPHRKPFGHIQHNPKDANSLSAGLVVSLLEDEAGSIWVGTIGGGLNRVNRQTGAVTRYRYQAAEAHALSHDIVWALAGGSDGSVWAGTSYGLNRYDPAVDGFRVYLPDATLADPVNRIVSDRGINSISGLVVDQRGGLWSSTTANHLVRFDPIRETFQPVSLPPSVETGYMMIGADTMLWFGATRGIYRMDLMTEEITRFSGEADGTGYDGILAFYQDQKGGLWVGTNSGLYRFARDGAMLARYTDTDGLPSSTIYSIVEDGGGLLWLSTNRGLASLDIRQPPARRIRTYDHASGLQNTEFNRNAYLKARDGTLFFGGDQGVTFFNPAQIRDNPYRPPVVLTALHRSTQQGTRSTRYFEEEPVEIAPDEYTFTFTFAALNFINPHRNQYAVMLEGFDEDWIALGTRRTATYTNVPPGRYRFRVKASNDDGLWNEEGIALALVVAPWFWETWWFRLLLGFSGMGLVAGGAFYVSRMRYQRQVARLRVQQALERERIRISRDMHDEVGASLTEIAILSELAQRQGGNGQGRANLEKIAATSRAMLDTLGEIIWAINPQHDRLDRVVAYLREYTAEYLENTPVRLELRFPQVVPALQVSAEFRRNVFLVLKEALHNMVKHAGARESRVTLRLGEHRFELRIEDDGCGFGSKAGRPGGQGLRNMKHRAEEIGGVLVIASEPAQGTRLHLSVPLDPSWGGHRAPVPP